MTRVEYLRRYKRYLEKMLKKVNSLITREHSKASAIQKKIERR